MQIIPILANNIYFSSFLVLSVYCQGQWGRNRKLSYLNLLGGLRRTFLSGIGEKWNQRTAQITKRASPFSCSVHNNKNKSLEENSSNHIIQGGVGEIEVARLVHTVWVGEGRSEQGEDGVYGQGRTWRSVTLPPPDPPPPTIGNC